MVVPRDMRVPREGVFRFELRFGSETWQGSTLDLVCGFGFGSGYGPGSGSRPGSGLGS